MVVLTYRKINVLDFPLAILKALQLNGTQWNPRIGLFVVQDFTPHTAGLDTIFVQIYMDALPGVPGVSKNQIFFFYK